MMLPSFLAARNWLLFIISFISFTAGAPTAISNRDLIDDLGSLASSGGLPSVNDIIQTGITTLVSLIEALKTGQIVQNGLIGFVVTNATNATNATATAQSTCPDVAVLFARGTDEPGNMGFLTGPPFATAMQHYANGTRLAIQGIDYPATSAGFLAGGSPLGAVAMALLTNDTAAACPDTKLVLSGYSQGAQVVRKACALLNNSTMGVKSTSLSSVVLFGDPGNGTAVPGVAADRVFTACHAGDNICEGGALVLPAHLNYTGDAPAAAMFVMQKTGLGMGSADAVLEGMGDVPMMSTTAADASSTVGLGQDMVVMDLSGGGKGKSSRALQAALGLGS